MSYDRPGGSIILSFFDMPFLLRTAALISRFHKRLIFDTGSTSLALCRNVSSYDFGESILRVKFAKEVKDSGALVKLLYRVMPEMLATQGSVAGISAVESQHTDWKYFG